MLDVQPHPLGGEPRDEALQRSAVGERIQRFRDEDDRTGIQPEKSRLRSRRVPRRDQGRHAHIVVDSVRAQCRGDGGRAAQ